MVFLKLHSIVADYAQLKYFPINQSYKTLINYLRLETVYFSWLVPHIPTSSSYMFLISLSSMKYYIFLPHKLLVTR